MSNDRPDLAQLTEAVIAFRDARDWKQFHNAKDVAISLSLEASELLELFQWSAEPDVVVTTRSEDLGDELADVFYWLLLMSHDCGIDLASALMRKLEKNGSKYPIGKSRGNARKYDSL
ncbi:MAG: nucleotide pyrophosphohydrolase [bacterium]|nr:nucleotide pyrophosphohydrolase [bacterium]